LVPAFLVIVVNRLTIEKPTKDRKKSESCEAQLLDELQRGNLEIQRRNSDLLKENYKQAPGGVRAKEAF
jgi:hypothetical protein